MNTNKFKKQAKNRINEKFKLFNQLNEKWDKIKPYLIKINILFSNKVLRNYVFKPVKKIFHIGADLKERDIFLIITQVSTANAIMAGLPGKMGIGVIVSLALEVWMAYSIAKKVGIQLNHAKDILKYFTLISGVLIVIFEGFHILLGLVFSAFAVLPFVNPMIPAELLVTNLVGILFYFGFSEVKKNRPFSIPKRMFDEIGSMSFKLTKMQWEILKKILHPKNAKKNFTVIGKRIKAWLKGDLILKQNIIDDEKLIAIYMTGLINNDSEILNDPIGKEFIFSIKDRIPDLADSNLSEIGQFFENYDEREKLTGILNLIKGKFFERLVVLKENLDHDELSAELIKDEMNPSTDIIVKNNLTGEKLELSLKATDSTSYIHEALEKYPDDPIMATSEVYEKMDDKEQLVDSGIDNEDLTRVTNDNFDKVLQSTKEKVDQNFGKTIVKATLFMVILYIWPFVAAYIRKKISKEQLIEAFSVCFGNTGITVAKRIITYAILGPLYAWYILAKMSTFLVKGADSL